SVWSQPLDAGAGDHVDADAAVVGVALVERSTAQLDLFGVTSGAGLRLQSTDVVVADPPRPVSHRVAGRDLIGEAHRVPVVAIRLDRARRAGRVLAPVGERDLGDEGVGAAAVDGGGVLEGVAQVGLADLGGVHRGGLLVHVFIVHHHRKDVNPLSTQ